MIRGRRLRSGVALCAVAASLQLTSVTSVAALTRSCAVPSLSHVHGLPSPVLVTTSCGRFEIGTGGRVRFLGPKRLPVPAGVNWYQDLSWYRVDRAHLVIGRGFHTYWRSHATYPIGRGAGVGAVAVWQGHVAFSFAAPPVSWKRPALYIALGGGDERAVAVGETPIGWTAGGRLVTWRHGGSLRVRDGGGRLIRTLAGEVYTFVFDPSTHSLLFLAHRRLEFFDGRRLESVLHLKAAGLSTPLTIQPAGAFIALRGQRRLVLARRSGAVVSSTALPHLRLRTDRVSSDIAADAYGDVAFTATRGNTANGSMGTETAYLLRRGARGVQILHRKRIAFAVCERQATVAWRGRWLLYTASEGYAVAVNASSRRTVDFSSTIARLPGTSGQDFAASWIR